MKTAGIDIGSRFIKFVLLQEDQVLEELRVDTGYEPKQTCEQLLLRTKPDHFTVTGYGRQLFSDDEQNDAYVITEIKAVAIGAHHFIPECRMIIDIGGQDTKAITLSKNGRVTSFEMNDRCAAGTGRFLEVMGKNLQLSLEELGALEGEETVRINSLCTVFAESEVISLIARGVKRESIGRAIQNLIATRVASLAKKQDILDIVAFTGGCAFNKYIKKRLEIELSHPVISIAQSPFLAAYGAALYAKEQDN